MKIFILLALLSTSAFADKMYQYTYVTKTEKCAVDIFVPTTGRIKIEKICFNLYK